MMNRNYPTIPSSYHRNFDQWAQSRCVETEVAAAIHAISGEGRTPEAIWENPLGVEADNVMMCLNEWAIHGDIEPGVYQWGGPFTVVDH